MASETKVRSTSKSSVNWRHSSTLRERMSYLFDNQLMADLVFVCKESQRFFAHKLIVSAGSQFFDDLISRSVTATDKWRMGYEDRKVTINVFEVDIKYMKPVIKYLYSDQLDITDSNASDIIYWSKKFKVRPVTDRALEYIGSKLNGTNCLHWWNKLTTNILAGDELAADVINRCLYLIAMNAKSRFGEQLFSSLNNDQVVTLFARNDLNINEFDLFKAAIQWADAKCKREGRDGSVDQNLRHTLGQAFDLIRFPLMSSYEFGLIITQYRNIFTREEVNSLIAYINSGVVIGHRLPFESKPRIPICCGGDHQTYTEPYYGQWRQPVCTAEQCNGHSESNGHYQQQWMASTGQALCQPQRTPLGYPQMYGTSFVPLSPPYSPSPQPMLATTPSLSPTSSLEVRPRLVYFCPPYQSINSLQNNTTETQPKRRTYASVVITDPKTGLKLDLKKLVGLKNGFKTEPNKDSSQQTMVSITELQDKPMDEDMKTSPNPSTNGYEMSDTYISDEEEEKLLSELKKTNNS